MPEQLCELDHLRPLMQAAMSGVQRLLAILVGNMIPAKQLAGAADFGACTRAGVAEGKHNGKPPYRH